ncbi:hypothetical protein U1Q18_052747 [Sarracenia purpurea var. burkii]
MPGLHMMWSDVFCSKSHLERGPLSWATVCPCMPRVRTTIMCHCELMHAVVSFSTTAAGFSATSAAGFSAIPTVDLCHFCRQSLHHHHMGDGAIREGGGNSEFVSLEKKDV